MGYHRTEQAMDSSIAELVVSMAPIEMSCIYFVDGGVIPLLGCFRPRPERKHRLTDFFIFFFLGAPGIQLLALRFMSLKGGPVHRRFRNILSYNRALRWGIYKLEVRRRIK